MMLSGWGRYPVLDCRLERLHERADLDTLAAGSGTLIARGNGRSYGDAALNPELTLSMLALNRLQAFDPATGMLTCEAGVLLADILETFVPRGWFPPVVPGTRLVTVGGMIAADVHGKNHPRDGSFGNHVDALTLATAGGETRECDRTVNSDLFRATIGGMGLTGVILSARLRLRPVTSAFVMQETLAARDLDETMDRFEASGDWPYRAAWIDGLARGAQRGRALVTRGRFADRAVPPVGAARRPRPRPPPRRARVPVDAPAALLNRVSVGVFNELQYRHGSSGCRGAPGALRSVLLSARSVGRMESAVWTARLGTVSMRAAQEGKRCRPRRPAGARGRGRTGAVPRRAQAAGRRGRRGGGLISFPMEGYTLALDFPLRRGTLTLLDALDEITHACGGRVYLAKDARCAQRWVAQGYPGYAAFRNFRSAAAQSRYASALSRRLAL